MSTEDPRPPQPYASQPPPGVPYPPAAPPRRPRWRTVLGWALIVLAVLLLLGRMAASVNGTGGSAPEGGGELVGYLLGMLLVLVVPLVAGILLLRRPKR